MLFNNFASLQTSNNRMRWNINQFVSHSNRRKHTYISTNDLDDKDAAELDKICRTMELEYAKVYTEYEQALKDLNIMSSQLKQRIEKFSSSGEPGEVEIQYRKMDMDIISTKIKISESKNKLFESKLKQIREERKLMFDRMKAAGKLNNIGTNVQDVSSMPGYLQVANDASVQQRGVGLTPELANLIKVQMINNSEVPKKIVNGVQVSSADPQPQTVVNQTNQESLVKEAEVAKAEVEVVDDGNTFQVKQTVQQQPTLNNNVNKAESKDEVETTVKQSLYDKLIEGFELDPSSIPNSDKVLNPMGSFGTATDQDVSIADQFVQNMNLIKQREANKKKLLANQEGVMGSKMMTSLNSIKNNTLDIKERLYVDTLSGKYWVEGYVQNENGDYEVCPTYIPKSIIHLGNLRFDVKNSLVKTAHYDDSIEFALSDESNMTPFYKEQWDKESSNQYVLDESVLELLQ